MRLLASRLWVSAFIALTLIIYCRGQDDGEEPEDNDPLIGDEGEDDDEKEGTKDDVDDPTSSDKEEKDKDDENGQGEGGEKDEDSGNDDETAPAIAPPIPSPLSKGLMLAILETLLPGAKVPAKIAPLVVGMLLQGLATPGLNARVLAFIIANHICTKLSE